MVGTIGHNLYKSKQNQRQKSTVKKTLEQENFPEHENEQGQPVPVQVAQKVPTTFIEKMSFFNFFFFGV